MALILDETEIYAIIGVYASLISCFYLFSFC